MRHVLTGAKQKSNVILRFAFGSDHDDSSNGVLIDDIQIFTTGSDTDFWQSTESPNPMLNCPTWYNPPSGAVNIDPMMASYDFSFDWFVIVHTSDIVKGSLQVQASQDST